MPSEDEPGVTERRQKKSSKSTVSREGNKVILEVQELLVNAQLAWGPYNAEKFYGHCVVKPKEAMLITVDVNELGTVSTIREVIEQLEQGVSSGVEAQIKMRRGRKEGETPITEIENPARVTAAVMSAAGPEEGDQF